MEESVLFPVEKKTCVKPETMLIETVLFGDCLEYSTSLHGQKFTPTPKYLCRYGRIIFCLRHRSNFSGIFDSCLHWVPVVRG